MAEEWGPWIEHDGKGCPVVGLFVQAQIGSGLQVEGVPSAQCAAPSEGCASAWIWETIPGDEAWLRVQCCRVRRPAALRRLIDMAENPSRRLPPRFPVEDLA